MSGTNPKRDIAFIRTGINIPADNGNPVDKKPDWFDERKYNRAKDVFKQYPLSIFLSHLSGLVLIFLFTPLVEPFLFTGESSSVPALRRRYLQTCKHVLKWYIGNIWDPKDSGHKSVLTVRNMHKNVANSMDSPSNETKGPEGMLFFSQTGMAVTQFTFIGWMICYPREIGLCCNEDDLECLLHFWRCIGYLLGMDDKYNICDGNYKESIELFKQIIEEEVKPFMRNPRKEGVKMSEDIIIAFSKVLPLLSWKAIKKYWFEIIDYPIEFTLDFYDKICYCFYVLLFKVVMKYNFARKIINSLLIYYMKKRLN